MHAYESTVAVRARDMGHGGLSAIRDGIEDAMSALGPDEAAEVEIEGPTSIRIRVTSPEAWGDVTRHLLRESVADALRGVLDAEAGETIEVAPFADAEPAPAPAPAP